MLKNIQSSKFHHSYSKDGKTVSNDEMTCLRSRPWQEEVMQLNLTKCFYMVIFIFQQEVMSYFYFYEKKVGISLIFVHFA